LRTLLALFAFTPAFVLGSEGVPADAALAGQDAVSRADAAASLLQQKLQARLAQAMAAGGPTAALAVCRDDAPRLAEEARRESGLRLGRTSDRLRNPANAPPEWARPHVSSSAGKRAEEVRPLEVDLGDRIGVLRPIAVKAACLPCHGAPGSFSPEVRQALAKAYPMDRAKGYSAGDWRGFIWVEVSK